jgi:hypothetical protein
MDRAGVLARSFRQSLRDCRLSPRGGSDRAERRQMAETAMGPALLPAPHTPAGVGRMGDRLSRWRGGPTAVMCSSFSSAVAPERSGGELPHPGSLTSRCSSHRVHCVSGGTRRRSVVFPTSARVPLQVEAGAPALGGSGKSPPGFRIFPGPSTSSGVRGGSGISGVRSRQASGLLRGSFPSAWRFQRFRDRVRSVNLGIPRLSEGCPASVEPWRSRFHRLCASHIICGSRGFSEVSPRNSKRVFRRCCGHLRRLSRLRFPVLFQRVSSVRGSGSRPLDDLKLRLRSESRKRNRGMFSTARRKCGGQAGGAFRENSERVIR